MRSFLSACLSYQPIALWPLGETSGTAAADAAFRAPADQTTLTYGGAPTLGQASLLPSTAAASVALNGTSQYAISAINLLHFNFLLPFSVGVWMRPAGLPAAGQFGRLVGKGGSWRLTFNSSSQAQFNQTASDGTTGSVVSAALSLNTVYFLLYTFDGATMTLYVNGASPTTTAYAKYPVQNNNAVAVGSNDGTSAFFNGREQFAAIFPSALTSTDAAFLYSVGQSTGTKTAPPPSPTAIKAVRPAPGLLSAVFDPSADDGGDPITAWRLRVV